MKTQSSLRVCPFVLLPVVSYTQDLRCADTKPLTWARDSQSGHLVQGLVTLMSTRCDQCSSLTWFANQVHTAMETHRSRELIKGRMSHGSVLTSLEERRPDVRMPYYKEYMAPSWPKIEGDSVSGKHGGWRNMLNTTTRRHPVDPEQEIPAG